MHVPCKRAKDICGAKDEMKYKAEGGNFLQLCQPYHFSSVTMIIQTILDCGPLWKDTNYVHYANERCDEPTILVGCQVGITFVDNVGW